MNAFLRPLCALLLGGLLPAQEAAPQDPQNPFRPFDAAAFVSHVQQLGATAEQVAAFQQASAELGPARAADGLLRNLLPDYQAAALLAENGDPKAALELTKVLTATADPVVQGHVRYHLARVFLDGDDPERAVSVLEDYIKQNANKTALDAEVVFFYAQAAAEIPQPKEALQLYQAFLHWFPDASERFRATAQQRAKELDRQLDSALHGLADGMKKVTRDLRKQDTGKPTQERQKEFLVQLDELIELYEQMERQSSGSPSGNGPSQAPANNSALPEGEARIGSLQNVRKVADRWGDMKQKDREQIESEVQNNLPPQYRKLLEEYYKRLGTGKNQ